MVVLWRFFPTSPDLFLLQPRLDVLVWDRLNCVKRTAVIKKLKAAAKVRGLDFDTTELTRHTAITVGTTTKTLGRHSEIDDVTARKFFDQYTDELGKGWWR